MTACRLRETLQNMIKRYTLIAALVSLLLLGLFVWWFQAGLLVTGVYVAVAALATLSVPLVYRLAGFADADDDEWLKERENREHAALLERLHGLKAELQALGLKEGIRQAVSLTDIIDDYHAVVKARFFGKQSSPLTYLGAARTVQKQAIQNLADMVAVAHSMSTIDSNRQAGSSKQDGRYFEQSERLRGLLDENNKLFDALTDTAVEVANIESISEFERTDTLARLVALAEVANSTGR